MNEGLQRPKGGSFKGDSYSNHRHLAMIFFEELFGFPGT